MEVPYYTVKPDYAGNKRTSVGTRGLAGAGISLEAAELSNLEVYVRSYRKLHAQLKLHVRFPLVITLTSKRKLLSLQCSVP